MLVMLVASGIIIWNSNKSGSIWAKSEPKSDVVGQGKLLSWAGAAAAALLREISEALIFWNRQVLLSYQSIVPYSANHCCWRMWCSYDWHMTSPDLTFSENSLSECWSIRELWASSVYKTQTVLNLEKKQSRSFCDLDAALAPNHLADDSTAADKYPVNFRTVLQMLVITAGVSFYICMLSVVFNLNIIPQAYGDKSATARFITWWKVRLSRAETCTWTNEPSMRITQELSVLVRPSFKERYLNWTSLDS